MTNQGALDTELLPEGETDIVWGHKGIAEELNCTEKKVGYLLAHTKLLNGAVKRISHKITIGSKSKLRNVAIAALAHD